MFESSVNPKGIKTAVYSHYLCGRFESSVNPKGIKTYCSDKVADLCLRVV